MVDDLHERAAALDGAAYLLGQIAARMQRDAATLLTASAALLSGERNAAAVAKALRRYAEGDHQLCTSEVAEIVHMIEGTCSPERRRRPRTQRATAEHPACREEIRDRVSFEGPEWRHGGQKWGHAITQAVELTAALIAAIRKAQTGQLEDNEKKYLLRLVTSDDGALVRWRFLQPARHRAAAFGSTPRSRRGEIVPLFGGTTDKDPNHAA